MKTRILIATLLFIAMWRMDGAAKTPEQSVIGPSGLEVGEVVSSFPVGFDLMMAGGKQFVAFYDANRQMTVAVRNINSKKWKYRKLDSFIGWDSHNYITMTTDKEGYIHLSGNMHNDTLVYFRSEKPYDIRSLKRIPAMTGDDEYRVTYPAFMRDRDDNLIFHYRSGGSGDGYELYNIYDQKTRTWKRLINGALINGRSDNSTMSAYMSGPVLGPDGVFHLIWVWRNTGDCSSNHTLSYAKSPDLIHWESHHIAGFRIVCRPDPGQRRTVQPRNQDRIRLPETNNYRLSQIRSGGQQPAVHRPLREQRLASRTDNRLETPLVLLGLRLDAGKHLDCGPLCHRRRQTGLCLQTL